MKKTKIASIILVGLSLMTMSACLKRPAESVEPLSYQEALEELGYTQVKRYNSDEWDEANNDGVYLSTSDSSEIEMFVSDQHLDKDTNTMTLKPSQIVSVIRAEKIISLDGNISLMSLEFKDKNDAKDYFEFMQEGLEMSKDAEISSTDNSCQSALQTSMKFDGEKYNVSQYQDVIYDGDCTVTAIFSYIYTKDEVYKEYKKFYKLINRTSPAELLKK